MGNGNGSGAPNVGDTIMRQVYETLKDQEQEKLLSEFIERKWNCKAYKLPRSYILDFGLCRNGRIMAFAEVKVRNNNMSDYDTIFVALHKVEAAQKKNLPVFFVVRWKDQIGYVRLDEEPDYLAMGGRADRNDPADFEPMAHYHISRVSIL